MKELDVDYRNLVLDNIREGILILDSELNFVFINQEAENIIGISSNRIKKTNDLNLLDEQVIDLVRKTQSDLETRYINEINFNNLFNKNNIISLYIKPILDYQSRSPHLEYILIQFRNLEAMHLLNKKKQYDEEEEIMSQLFYGLAHEIKNPLAGIKGAAQLIKKEKNSSEKTKECSNIIEKEAVRLANLVDTFNHLQPHSEDTYSKVDINNLLNEVIEICSKDQEKKKVSLFVSLELESAAIFCDKELLRIVLLNVLKNAYDSIKSKGEIKINTNRITDFKVDKKSFFLISINDNGKGIEKDKLDKIFQPFFTTKKNGQGFGLFLSQKIINKFGGFIEASSNGNGATFKIYLPIN